MPTLNFLGRREEIWSKNSRRIFRYWRFRLWLFWQNYIHENVGIHEGPKPSLYYFRPSKEIENEQKAVRDAIDRLIERSQKNSSIGQYAAKKTNSKQGDRKMEEAERNAQDQEWTDQEEKRRAES